MNTDTAAVLVDPSEPHTFEPDRIFFHDGKCQRPGCGFTRTHPRHNQGGRDHG